MGIVVNLNDEENNDEENSHEQELVDLDDFDRIGDVLDDLDYTGISNGWVQSPAVYILTYTAYRNHGAFYEEIEVELECRIDRPVEATLWVSGEMRWSDDFGMMAVSGIPEVRDAIQEIVKQYPKPAIWQLHLGDGYIKIAKTGKGFYMESEDDVISQVSTVMENIADFAESVANVMLDEMERDEDYDED